MKQIIESKTAPEPIGPYSQAVLIDKTLYVSGQIPIDPESRELINSTIREETHRVMKNLRAVLNEARMDFRHVVKCSIFVKNMEDFQVINEVYGEYFEDRPPARETIGVTGLPKNVSVEISCIAVME